MGPKSKNYGLRQKITYWVCVTIAALSALFFVININRLIYEIEAKTVIFSIISAALTAVFTFICYKIETFWIMQAKEEKRIKFMCEMCKISRGIKETEGSKDDEK